MNTEALRSIGEYCAAGIMEEPEAGLFLRKARGFRRYYENCNLPPYRGGKLYPSGQAVCPHYMAGYIFDINKISGIDPETAERLKNDVMKPYCRVPAEHTVAGAMWTHSMPNYERIIAEGFDSYEQRVSSIKDDDLREGLTDLISGIRIYAERCADYLESCNADSCLVSALRRVPMQPAKDIYDAIVCWNFILYLDGCDNLGCLASGLTPYYKGEDVTGLLSELFDNLDSNNGWSMALGTDYGPLTLQCLEASRGKRRPMIELFVDQNTPDEIWEKAFDLVRSGNGQPAFYNPHVLLDGLRKRFPVINREDVKRFCGGGCTEAMIAGLSNVGSLDAGINLPLILESVIAGSLEKAETFDEFYDAYLKAVSDTVDRVTDGISESQKIRSEVCPLPMRTLLIDDCIEKGLDYNNGGARYKWSIINFAGMINVIDSMLVIDSFVFRDRIYEAGEFCRKLKENDPVLLEKARKHTECFGSGNEKADSFASRISSDLYSMLDGKKPYIGEGFLPASIQFMSQVAAGKAVGATPDGRESGSPLCDSLASVFGKDVNGPTALLKSVTSLDLERALGVPVLNFNIEPDFRPEILKGLILAYMELGGIQMQITCISREMLEDAYAHPDLYRNLIVRVGGYSEYFCLLSDELKRMVINRTVQKRGVSCCQEI
ncbi:MAG: hypothetical protein J5850_00975 [Clostridia bacterium]|nr:hypothetical protein [Clostridia bacterium]